MAAVCPRQRALRLGLFDSARAQLPFGHVEVLADLEQCQGEPAGFALLLVGAPQLSLSPPSMGLLDRLGHALELALGNRWHPAPHGKCRAVDPPGQSKLAGAVDGPHERGVPAIAHPEPQRHGGRTKVQVEPIGLPVEAVSDSAHKPCRGWPEHAEPELFHVVRAGIVTEVVDDGIDPRLDA